MATSFAPGEQGNPERLPPQLMTVPGPSSWVPGGAYWPFRRDPLAFFTETARTYGDIAGFSFGPQKVYLLSHPDLVERVLLAPANQFGSGAGQAWAAGHTGVSNIYVGIIDEGVMPHADFGANVWVNPGETPGNGVDDDGNGYVDDVRGWDFDGDDNTTYDGNQDDHGTHVAGTIGALGGNSVGVAGMNWNVTIIPAKFLGRRGGSTLTMQLAAYLHPELEKSGRRSVVAKWRQLRQALAIERAWSKDEILEAWLNLTPFRGEVEGVDAAARTLFGKHAQGLDRVESALLAALVRAPNSGASRVARRACGLLHSVEQHMGVNSPSPYPSPTPGRGVTVACN